MSLMSLTRRPHVALLLASFFLALPALGAPALRPADDRPVLLSAVSVFSRAWSAVLRIWEKEGSAIDPYGNAKPNLQDPAPGGTSPSAQSNPPGTTR
jgi:hypothetical protein